jgi:hypothetical protein
MTDYLRARHLCLVTEDLARAKRDIPFIFGVDLAYTDPEVDVFGIENALFTCGLSLLEIAQPIVPAAATRRFLDQSGGRGGYVIAINCSDPIERGRRANALGVRTVADLDYVHGNFRAIQLHPKDCHGVMLEFDHTVGGERLLGPLYAAGGAGWPASVNTSRTVGFTEAVMRTPDPGASADLWSKMLDRPAVASDDGHRIDMDMFALVFEAAAPGERAAFSAIGIKVKDPSVVLSAARDRGYLVSGNAIDLCGVTFRVT